MQTLDCKLLQEKGIRLHLLRLDTIHPVISGNKLFKLQYFLEGITDQAVITFGGAYSNHLVATAYACKEKNIPCIGIVRGDRPLQLSHTLQHCIEYGMQLDFTSREAYDQKDSAPFIDNLKSTYTNCIIIPEGGYDITGAKGAAGIMDHIPDEVTHICCALGTATTVAGLLLQIKAHQKIIVFPALKGLNDIEQRLRFLTNSTFDPGQIHIKDNYHFGGYAKKTNELISFMNDMYNEHQLPTDFVYTGKMMYGIMDMIKNNFFEPGSAVCCIHTGGLQGNLSLPKSTLTF